MSNEHKKDLKGSQTSNWSLIYDAIKLYPRFERLKKFIHACKVDREKYLYDKKKSAFEDYLKKQMVSLKYKKALHGQTAKAVKKSSSAKNLDLETDSAKSPGTK